ncbi:MAG: tyrosine-type recombinase/integrase [Scytonema sp. PMC 1070.18]|nr:tyrosine-type recombinase/integrase [Scytonema sp. PMC 1070.18]
MNECKPSSNYKFLAHNQEAKLILANPLLQKDVWHTIDDLGLIVNLHSQQLTLNFENLLPDWLKILVKLYILEKSRQNLTAQYLGTKVSHLKKFSRFLADKSVYTAEQINSQIFQEFDDYLQSLNLAKRTISCHYITLGNFFDVCRLSGWLDISTYWFIGKRLPTRGPKNDEVEYIPEEVWNQLEQNLHFLPEPIQRMVIIMKTTGIRVGELLNLPLDCLRKRGTQWRLRFTTEKYRTIDEMPIISELAIIIKEQQKYIRHHFNNDYDKLFCSNRGNRHGFMPAPRVMSLSTFNKWLNKLASESKITSNNGEIWHFASHQFRRTIGTVLTNAGIRDLIIQKYLRHRSPDMQRHYKHLLKQVLSNEYEELMKSKKYVDISGQVVLEHKPQNAITELMRRKMYQITTQYGECHRPVIKSPCQTVNACWRCEHWRTSTDDLPDLVEDLKQVESELKLAEQLGMVKQKQGLEIDSQNLSVRIKGLNSTNARN